VLTKKISVGGPATCQSEWLTETLNFCEENNVFIDFISTHEYPTDIVPTQRDTLKKVITKARQEVGKMPLFYTEYNDGLFPALHDTIYASAFAIFNIQDVYGLPDILSWWTFSDIFEEEGFDATPFHGGYGLQNIYGIPKPAFRAFELLHETGSHRFPVILNNSTTSTAGGILTVNATHVHLLLYNHNVTGGAIKTENICVLIQGINSEKKIHPILRRIDENNANPIAIWKKMGSPMYPTLSQNKEMMEASEMVHINIDYEIISSSEIAFSLSIPPEGVACITFEY